MLTPAQLKLLDHMQEVATEWLIEPLDPEMIVHPPWLDELGGIDHLPQDGNEEQEIHKQP